MRAEERDKVNNSKNDVYNCASAPIDKHPRC